jgi:catechol 2,3-dioxygenase
MVKKRLGEIVLRTPQREEMVDFYTRVIGLEPYKELSIATFLKVSDDLNGHPQVLAIFDPEIASNGPGEPTFTGHDVSLSPLHHLAFAVDADGFDAELRRIADLGHEVRTAAHRVMGWRSFYIYDPDGNTVEFVRSDPTLFAASGQ